MQLNQELQMQKLKSDMIKVDSAAKDELRFAKNIFKFTGLDPFLTYTIKLAVFKGIHSEVVCAGQLCLDSHEFELLFD